VSAAGAGSYACEATVDGFEPAVRAGRWRRQTLAIDITLDVGRRSETVSVEATTRVVRRLQHRADDHARGC